MQTKTNYQTKLMHIGLSIMLLLASSKIKIPFYPVPITLHTFAFGVNMMLFNQTYIPILAYFGIVSVFPMFSTGLLYAGGYVLGMAIAGLLLNRMQSTWSKYLLAMVITYITGASWLHFAFGFNFVRCIAPYLLHEAIKVAGIYGIQRAMR